jgi:hypothetical protein
MKVIPVLALSPFLTCLASSVAAQTSRHEISFAAGVSQFDASGTGTAPVGALRLSLPLFTSMVIG